MSAGEESETDQFIPKASQPTSRQSHVPEQRALSQSKINDKNKLVFGIVIGATAFVLALIIVVNYGPTSALSAASGLRANEFQVVKPGISIYILFLCILLFEASDQRDYKFTVLSNGLEVLLVSDPKTQKSAAAIDVHVGSFNDPVDSPLFLYHYDLVTG